MFKHFIILIFLLQASLICAADVAINVIDEAGKPVPKFDIMWHTGDSGYSPWQRCEKGYWRDTSTTNSEVVDLIVRADGFASKVQRFEWKSLREGRSTLQLERGREVIIETVGLHQPIPKLFMMESFFGDYSRRVHMMWSPVNIRDVKPDWNMLNVQQVDDTHFSFRVSDSTGKFFLAFQHPGWLRFCEFGPYSPEEIAASGLQLKMPTPAKINVTFDPNSEEAKRPFQSQNCVVYWAPDETGAVINVTKGAVPIDPKNPLIVTDLGPGKYLVQVRTEPLEPSGLGDGTEINRGAFFDAETIVLKSGEEKQVDFKWTPFNPNKFQGKADAELKIVTRGNSVPANRKVEVSWFDGHYGSLKVFEGPLPDDGVIHLKGVTAMRYRAESRVGSYRVSMDDEWLGFFSLEDTTEIQKFKFAAAPKPGDPAPDIDLIDIESLQSKKLSDFRGQIVVLEFWATWCGPCQPAMRKLNDLAEKMPDSWKNRVTLLGLSTDQEPEVANIHVSARGWKGLKQYQVKREADQHFSDAEIAYGVNGIPHAILIDEKGIVRWSGHPISEPPQPQLVDLVNELLK